MPWPQHPAPMSAEPLPLRGSAPHCPGCRQPVSGGTCTACVDCARCHRPTGVESSVTTVRGSAVCASCRERWYWQCASCDGWNRRGDDCGNDCARDCHCGDCADCDDTFDGLVHDYSYRPLPDFHGQGPLFLGPEIEVEAPYDRRGCARLAVAALGDLGYLKEDGSLSVGFEIVTHPMSYDYALRHFPWQLLTELASHGCQVSDRTGIHVHLSRAGFTGGPHVYRWMKFIYRNEAEVVRLARRRTEQWAAFTADDRRAVKDYAKGLRGERYRAINTGNPHTFELRIFAGSLDPAQVQAALGFAAASVEYTRALTVPQLSAGAWTWPAFTRWLSAQAAYTPLHRQLEAPSCAC